MTHHSELSGFSRVYVEGATSVDIVHSDKFVISSTGEDSGHLRIEAAGDTLRIGRRGIGWGALLGNRPRASVAMPILRGIALSGASQGKVSGFDSSEELSLKLNGASHLEMARVRCARLRVEISGASNLTGEITATEGSEFGISGASRVELSGEGGKARIELAGASQSRLSRLSLGDTQLTSSGASSAQINLNGKLDINLSGASKVEYAGNAVMGNVHISGASTFSHRS
jgi:hypothetical protein